MQSWAHVKTGPLEKLNFNYAFRPIYYFSRFAGLWPFSIIRDSNGKIRGLRIGFFDILRSLLLTCLNLALAFGAYEEIRVREETHAESIRAVVFMIFQMSCFLFITIGVVLDLINRNKILNILMKFNTFDREVRHFCQISLSNSNAKSLKSTISLQQKQISRFGVHFNYKREARRSWVYFMSAALLLSFFVTFHTFEVLVLHEDLWLTLYRFGSNFVQFIARIPVLMSFIFFIRCLCERFAVLNALLR